MAPSPAHLPPRRRSCLTVPGASDKMLAKAAGLTADEIVFDLEDSVPLTRKVEARSRVAALLAEDAWRRRTVSVRINAVGSPWFKEDVQAMAGVSHPHLSLVVPKVEKPDDLAAVDRLSGNTPTQALIETATGLAFAREIASGGNRLQALILGYADLAASLGRPADSTQSWRFAQETLLLAARAGGLQAIDGPYFQIADGDGLRRESDTARQLGFDGKWAIHPSQIEAINAAFTPSADEISRARALIGALDAAQQAGAGAIAFEGAMIDEAMRPAALRTLARAAMDAAP